MHIILKIVVHSWEKKNYVLCNFDKFNGGFQVPDGKNHWHRQQRPAYSNSDCKE
jgi:hypothetical protein